MSNAVSSTTSFVRNITLRFSGSRPLLMLRAYFDDGGHPNDHAIVVIGGALSTLQKWEALEEQWKVALVNAGSMKDGHPYFHMTEFESYISPFDWSKLKHEHVLNELLHIMHEHIDYYVGGCLLAGSGSSTVHEDFMHRYRNYNTAEPYFRNFTAVIDSVESLTEQQYSGETTQIVFADQKEGAQSLQWYRKLKDEWPEQFLHIESIAFAPYIKTVQLHTADLIANTLIRQFKHYLKNDGVTTYPMSQLFKGRYRFVGLGGNMNHSSE